MNRSLRIAAVTAGLLLAGAVAGAVAADVAVAIALAITGSPIRAAGFEPLMFVAVVGALFGGVLLPVTAWLFLRRVPLGLALLGTLAGTVVGGVLGWVFPPMGDMVQGGVIGAVAGFALAALVLRLRASAPSSRRAVSVQG
jgi:hypothetical protein